MISIEVVLVLSVTIAAAGALPDPLVSAGGQKVTTAEAWRTRRQPEIIALFEKYVYGKMPGRVRGTRFEVTSVEPKALDGKATRKEVSVHFAAQKRGPRMDILIYSPNDRKRPAPTFVGMNFFGNHSISQGPRDHPVEAVDARYEDQGRGEPSRDTRITRSIGVALARREDTRPWLRPGDHLLQRPRPGLPRRVPQRGASAVRQEGPAPRPVYVASAVKDRRAAQGNAEAKPPCSRHDRPPHPPGQARRDGLRLGAVHGLRRAALGPYAAVIFRNSAICSLRASRRSAGFVRASRSIQPDHSALRNRFISSWYG